jgi:hypothetical protein
VRTGAEIASNGHLARDVVALVEAAEASLGSGEPIAVRRSRAARAA